MHTSTRLRASDFHYWQRTANGLAPIDFATFCPDYHELDRVGVVSPTLEAGVYQTSYALLAFTTAFYDRLRARGGDFFDYPQHFAFVGAADDHLCTSGGPLPLDTPNLWDAWSWLDVWPANKWVPTPVTATGMLQRVFDYQINRLFWPRELQLGANEPELPPYVWKMLRTRLKAVYYYRDNEETSITPAGEEITLYVTPAGKDIVKESFELLAKVLHPTQPLPRNQCYEAVCVEAFLSALHPGIK